MKTRPLFGICPLFGVSVKREFTVLINDWILTCYGMIEDFLYIILQVFGKEF